MKLKHWLFSVFVCASLQACRDEDDPQERINKLRALGVDSNPVVATAATAAGTVELTFYAAVPKDKTVSFEPFADKDAKYSVVQTIKIVSGSEKYTEYAAFRLFSVRAMMDIPANAALRLVQGQANRLRYGMKLTSEAEEEKVVGDVLVFGPGSEQGNWKAPTISIDAPGAQVGAGAEVELIGKVTKPQSEAVKVGWFVSGGSVKNRRAPSTIWNSPDPGSHTVILTARGAESRSFALVVKNVPVQ